MIKVIGVFYTATGNYGVAPGDERNTFEQVIEGDDLYDVRQQIQDILANWKVLRHLYIEHPDNPEYRQEVAYMEFFKPVIEQEQRQKVANCNHRFKLYIHGDLIAEDYPDNNSYLFGISSGEYEFSCARCGSKKTYNVTIKEAESEDTGC